MSTNVEAAKKFVEGQKGVSIIVQKVIYFNYTRIVPRMKKYWFRVDKDSLKPITHQPSFCRESADFLSEPNLSGFKAHHTLADFLSPIFDKSYLDALKCHRKLKRKLQHYH